MSTEPPPATDPVPPPPPHSAAPPPVHPIKPGISGATVGIIAVLLVLIFAGVWFFSHGNLIGSGGSGPEAAANGFFKTNGDDGPSAAYAKTSPAFREATPEPTWSNISARLGLAAYSGADWADKDVSGDVASLHGTIHRLNQADLKASVQLRRIEGAWRVMTVSVQDPSGLAATQPIDPVNPQTQPNSAQVQPQPQAQSGYPTPQTVSPPDANAQANAAPSGTPGPVMSVPRYGAAPMSTPSSGLPLGRAGPPGVAMASGQVGPECMSPLWKMGFHADEVRCPLYLPTIPGRTELCTAHATDGRVGTVTVTFLDYDPITRKGTFDCHLN